MASPTPHTTDRRWWAVAGGCAAVAVAAVIVALVVVLNHGGSPKRQPAALSGTRRGVAATTIPTTTTPAATAPVSTSVAPTTAPAPSTTVAAPTRSAAPVLVADDCQHLAYEPSGITLACGDGSIRATGIRWSTWSPTSAAGTATVLQVVCSPDCANGYQVSDPATIILSSPEATAGGPAFAMASVTFTGAVPPNGSAVEHFPLLPLS
ncbi:MAG: hypothetical protein ACYC1D_09925 [Acidimicrobiales bacterium]